QQRSQMRGRNLEIRYRLPGQASAQPLCIQTLLFVDQEQAATGEQRAPDHCQARINHQRLQQSIARISLQPDLLLDRLNVVEYLMMRDNHSLWPASRTRCIQDVGRSRARDHTRLKLRFVLPAQRLQAADGYSQVAINPLHEARARE